MKKNILEQFNKSLERLTTQSKELSELLNNSTNLKLYDIVCLDNFEDRKFENFCVTEYENFESFMDEHNLIKQHIGTTSTFYFNSKYYDMYDFEYHGKINPRNLTKLICENSGIDTDYIKVNDKGIIEDLKSVDFADGSSSTWEEYFLDNFTLDDFVRDLDSEVEKFFEEIEEIKLGYDYVNDFKNNQVRLYNEF